MGVFDNAKIVKINNTEVDSIKTNDGRVIYQRPTIITVNTNSISFGKSNKKWLNTTGNVVINWGDSSANTVNNPTTPLSHTYTDGKQNHNIVFLGIVISLEDYCFNDCTGLTSIIIPLSVTSLEDYCFKGCTGLTSITIPSSVTSLGSGCFKGCTGLTSITIPSSVTSLAYGCFSGCTGLTSITIPSSVTNLENNCFSGCTGLTSITIPSSITSLGTQCFYNCTHLTSVVIPNSVTTLGLQCFMGCTGLTSVTISSSVTSLGNHCFYGCASLNTYQLYWTNNNIITYDSNKMPNNTNTKFYVPKGQKTNYVNKGYPSAKVVERSS